MNSIWCRDVQIPEFRALEGDTKTDILIVGGGITGILCAYMLEKAGTSYILVEADTICSGITGNTTAKITAQHGLIYDKIMKSMGQDKARLYLEANIKALGNYAQICKDINCDFERADSYVYSLNDWDKIEKETKALKSIGFPATAERKIPLPIKVAGAVKMPNQAQFNPIKFLYGISRGLNICEHTKVQEFLPDRVKTNRGEIKANKIIITTHFPIINKHGQYPLKLYQHRSYVLALSGAGKVNGMYVDEAKTGLSFRNYGDLLLLGGGSHRTGKSGGGWHELEEFAKRNYPGSKVVDRFATQDCMSLDSVAYIGRYSKNTENLYVATGYNKWGMTTSMVAAQILSDTVLNRMNRYAAVFSPSRSIFTPQLAVNTIESVAGLLTPSVPRCPHLGCALRFNKEEHSWDCPCHGSRFAEDGSLIDNPATDDKKKI